MLSDAVTIQEFFEKHFVTESVKGAVLAVLYFEITQADDTTLINVLKYTAFYLVVMFVAMLVGVGPQIVLNSFITKTIFTLVDDRIKGTGDVTNSAASIMSGISTSKP